MQLTGKNIARSARDGVMLLEKQPDRSMQASKIFSGIFNDDDDNNGSLRKKSNLLKGGSNSNLDNSSDEDEDEKLAKDLAFRTSEAVRWLYDRDRLTLNEKRLITKDIIENVGIGGFSRAEIAYCLLIGGMRPGEDDLDDVPRDLSLVDPEDVQDFEDICHQYTG